ncbi:o-succinylbenzoate synthase [Shewanella gaetbuli]
MCHITAFEIHQYQIDLSTTLPVAKQRIDHRVGLIVTVTLSDGQSSVAEVAPLSGIDIEGLPLQGFSQENLEQVTAALFDIQQQVMGEGVNKLALLTEQCSLASVQFGLSVLVAKLQQRLPIRQLEQHKIPLLYHGLSTSSIEEKLTPIADINTVKIKVAQTDMAEEIAFVHQILAYKPKLTLRLDANGGFTLDQAIDFLACIPKAQIDYIEEPCQQLSDNATVYKQLGIKYALDESLLQQPIDFTQLLEQQPGIGALILKPMLLGSLTRLQEIVTLAEQYGVRCILSSSLESDIGINDLALISQALTPDNPPGLDTLSAFSQKLISPDGSVDYSQLTPLEASTAL